MKVLYIADDGKKFENKFDCLEYEWKLNHPSLKDICFYDKDNNLLEDIFSDKIYQITEKVVVTNKDQLGDLFEFARYTGFCSYYDIIDCGEWVFNGNIFVKI